jgi:hypothetical protein
MWRTWKNKCEAHINRSHILSGLHFYDVLLAFIPGSISIPHCCGPQGRIRSPASFQSLTQIGKWGIVMMDRVDRLEHLQNGLLSFYWRSKNKTLSTLINIGDFSGSKMKLRTIPYPHSAKWCLVTLTRLKTIGNKLGDEMVWRSIKCGLKDCARNSWESNKHQNHPRTTTNRTEQPIIPDLDSLWQSRCLLIKPHHWHYDTWTEIRVWAAATGKFFTGQPGYICASVLERRSLQFRQKNEDPFHPFTHPLWFEGCSRHFGASWMVKSEPGGVYIPQT